MKFKHYINIKFYFFKNIILLKFRNRIKIYIKKVSIFFLLILHYKTFIFSKKFPLFPLKFKEINFLSGVNWDI